MNPSPKRPFAPAAVHRLVAPLALALAALLLGGCDKPNSPAPVVATVQTQPATAPAAVVTPPTPSPTPDAVRLPTAEVVIDSDQPTTQWLAVKTATFDLRDQVFPVVAQLEARVDEQIAELNAKRATMTGTVQTDKWDFAMTEMNDARAYLRSMSEELRAARAENWDQLKDKVDRAWVRTQDAVRKVKASTTS